MNPEIVTMWWVIFGLLGAIGSIIAAIKVCERYLKQTMPITQLLVMYCIVIGYVAVWLGPVLLLVIR